MSRKYSAGDVVLLTQKKEVKKGHHRINLNGIQYTVSSDFDGLLLVISYRADLGAYSVRELHGSERRHFNVPLSILDRYSQYAKPRNKFSQGDTVLVTPKDSRSFGSYREYRVGEGWIDASLGNVLQVDAVNEPCELYLVRANGARATVHFDDLESCAELLPEDSEAEREPASSASADTEKGDDITEITLTPPNRFAAQRVSSNTFRLYSTPKNARIVFPTEITEKAVEQSALRFRLFRNNLTDELFFVFESEGGLDVNTYNFKRNHAISNRQLVRALVSKFNIKQEITSLKISENLSKKEGFLTFKVIGKE